MLFPIQDFVLSVLSCIQTKAVSKCPKKSSNLLLLFRKVAYFYYYSCVLPVVFTPLFFHGRKSVLPLAEGKLATC
jgi:hypothetical protein